jgi:trimethylamine--corrinoid protein Co-methyltransferase
MLSSFEAPALDPAVDEALLDFVKRKKDSMPDAFT